jgi:hypothetical protein
MHLREDAASAFDKPMADRCCDSEKARQSKFCYYKNEKEIKKGGISAALFVWEKL